MTIKESRKQVWLYIASRLWFAVGFASILPALFSFLIFDAPGSTEILPTLLLSWSVKSFPFIGIGSSLGIRFLKDHVLAVYLSLLPLVNVILFLVALYWLNVSCGGSFNCQP
jgi:hypothetical protein